MPCAGYTRPPQHADHAMAHLHRQLLQMIHHHHYHHPGQVGLPLVPPTVWQVQVWACLQVYQWWCHAVDLVGARGA